MSFPIQLRKTFSEAEGRSLSVGGVSEVVFWMTGRKLGPGDCLALACLNTFANGGLGPRTRGGRCRYWHPGQVRDDGLLKNPVFVRAGVWIVTHKPCF